MPQILIQNGMLIDGLGGAPRPGSLLIEGDGIRALGAEAERLAAPEAERIDATGQWILPGFIDTHVHMMLELRDLGTHLGMPFSYRFYESVRFLERTLATGITSVRDAGFSDLGMKKAVEDGIIAGPRLQISLNPLTITGGHGDFWMASGIEAPLVGVAHPGLPEGRCDGVAEVRKAAREMLRAGADIIKVHATGGVTSPTDHPDFVQFSPEELGVMVEEARFRAGRKVMAHAQGAEGIKNAVRAGVHSIEHGIYLDDEAIDLMLERGTFLVPTLLAPVAVMEAAENGHEISDYVVEKCREVLDSHRESIARAHRAGVRIAMGTDAGVMPHGTNLRELELMCDIGMSPMEAIVATTRIAAECLGWEDRTGTLEAGKWADVVLVDADPLARIRDLEDPARITTVIKAGRICKSPPP